MTKFEVQIPIVDNISIVVEAADEKSAIDLAYAELARRQSAPNFPGWISLETDDGGVNVFPFTAIYEVIANGTSLGLYEAESEQEARDLCARDAGYESEADMVDRLEQPSALEARPL